MLRADRVNGIHLLCCVSGDGAAADLGEDLQAHVAASFGPFVVLFHEHGADEADDGVAAGEDADDVGAAPQLAVQALFYPALTAGSS